MTAVWAYPWALRETDWTEPAGSCRCGRRSNQRRGSLSFDQDAQSRAESNPLPIHPVDVSSVRRESSFVTPRSSHPSVTSRVVRSLDDVIEAAADADLRYPPGRSVSTALDWRANTPSTVPSALRNRTRTRALSQQPGRPELPVGARQRAHRPRVSRIDLESIGYPTAFHPHGESYGHLKNFAATDDVSRVLLSQCFCEACQERADVDLEATAQLVRDLLAVVERRHRSPGDVDNRPRGRTPASRRSTGV
ncbi:hypothetical protein D8S78_22215 [Natrialba swarupiae]|nr:hypothetical protein [Natrialba swarupiae]